MPKTNMGGFRARMSVRIPYWLARLLPGLLCALLIHHIWRARQTEGTLLEGLSQQFYPKAARVAPPAGEVEVRDVTFKAGRALGHRIGPIRGAESFAVSPTGAIYTGTSDGELLELLPNGFGPDDFAGWGARSLETFERILGLKSLSVRETSDSIEETLLVCDADLGLFEVEVVRPKGDTLSPATSANPKLLLDWVNGKKVTVCNGVDYVKVGDEIYIVFTDSAEIPLAQLGAEVFAESGSGRVVLFKYATFKNQKLHPPEHYAQTILERVRFSNGIYVQESPKGHLKIIVAETLGRALLEIDYDTIKDKVSHTRAAWAGAFHVDNLEPLVPKLPLGAEKLSHRPTAANGLNKLPKNYLLVGIPHCTAAWQERLLYSSKRFRRFISGWLPLPIRIAMGNPILFSNSAIGLFDIDSSTFVQVLRASPRSSSHLKFTSEGSPWWQREDADMSSYNVSILLGSFSNSEPIKATSLILAK